MKQRGLDNKVSQMLDQLGDVNEVSQKLAQGENMDAVNKLNQKMNFEGT